MNNNGEYSSAFREFIEQWAKENSDEINKRMLEHLRNKNKESKACQK